MNKRKNNDESVIFLKRNRGNRPQNHETLLHVSSFSWPEIALHPSPRDAAMTNFV
jgi:hypothetical protein